MQSINGNPWDSISQLTDGMNKDILKTMNYFVPFAKWSFITGMIVGGSRGIESAGRAYAVDHMHFNLKTRFDHFTLFKLQNYARLRGGIIEGGKMGAKLACLSIALAASERAIAYSLNCLKTAYPNSFSWFKPSYLVDIDDTISPALCETFFKKHCLSDAFNDHDPSAVQNPPASNLYFESNYNVVPLTIIYSTLYGALPPFRASRLIGGFVIGLTLSATVSLSSELYLYYRICKAKNSGTI